MLNIIVLSHERVRFYYLMTTNGSLRLVKQIILTQPLCSSLAIAYFLGSALHFLTVSSFAKDVVEQGRPSKLGNSRIPQGAEMF